ncbi:protein turtle-like [Aphis craccivora]|uniref:Protein turtle-like n=1 Tax=Aphis craccivora TaxID=307492 RepID=A0A6G0ZQ76_APHCR|nr:protein turtle-like [Aphis craccivora]
MAKGQKGVSVVMCVERVIGNLMDSANGFHAPKPDLDVKQENNNPRNNKVFDQFLVRIKIPMNSLEPTTIFNKTKNNV